MFSSLIGLLLSIWAVSSALGQPTKPPESAKTTSKQIDDAISSGNLDEMKKLTERLITFYERDNPNLRREKIGLWAKLRAAVVARTDPKFDVTKDLAVGNLPEWDLPPGVTPDTIKDPEKRRAYKNALELHHQKIERSLHEAALFRLRDQIDRLVAIHCAWEYDRTEDDQQHLLNDLVDYPNKEKIIESAKSISK